MPDSDYSAALYKEDEDTLVAASGAHIKTKAGATVETGHIGDANVIGQAPVLHRIDVPDGAGDTDVVLTYKTKIVDFWVEKTGADGGAGDTVTLQEGANAISDALDLNVTDKSIVRAGELDDAFSTLDAGATLRLSAANVTNNACTAYVLGARVD